MRQSIIKHLRALLLLGVIVSIVMGCYLLFTYVGEHLELFFWVPALVVALVLYCVAYKGANEP